MSLLPSQRQQGELRSGHRNMKEREYIRQSNRAIQGFGTVIALAVVFVLPLSALAQNASETIYKSKCAACHGPDGTGSAMGKKLGAHDFGGAEVQKMSDTELSDIIVKGKNKMPTYEKTLKADEITVLVAYIRELRKAK